MWLSDDETGGTLCLASGAFLEVVRGTLLVHESQLSDNFGLT